MAEVGAHVVKAALDRVAHHHNRAHELAAQAAQPAPRRADGPPPAPEPTPAREAAQRGT